MRALKALVAAVAVVFAAACGGPEVVDPGNGGGGGGGGNTGGGTGITLSVDVMQNLGSAEQQDVVLNWMPGPDDGYGPLDGFRATATDSIAQTDTNYVAEPGRTTTFTFGPWAINTVVSGSACVRAERRALSSAFVCTGWSASVDDEAPPSPIMDSVRAVSLHDSIGVIAYYRLGADDGGGAYTMAVYARDDSGVDSVSIPIVPPSAGSQFVALEGYTYGQTYTGQACVTTTRRALFSQACASFTALVVDVPPPPPILPVSLEIYPQDAQMVTMFAACDTLSQQLLPTGYPKPECVVADGRAPVQQFCAMLQQSDSSYYMLSGQDTLQICRDVYDSLPAGQLPGYPTASVRPYMRDGTQLAYRRASNAEELASIVFENPFTPKVNVFAYAKQTNVTVNPNGIAKAD